MEDNLSKKVINKTFFSKFKKDTFVFVCAALVLMMIKSTLYEPFQIPSGSMLPTLKVGDFILVDKKAYGYKIPFTDYLITSLPQEKVERGDVVVFKFPKNTKVNYIKRVIGLPGDKIKIIDKKVYINGNIITITKLDEKTTESIDLDPRYKDTSFEYYKAILNGNVIFRYQLDKDNFFKVDYDEVTIPANQYFVLGDNRDFSNDSRYWGFVPRHYIKGKAKLIWLSIGHGSEDRNSYFFRSNRFGMSIK